jgi:hypothetical protein
MYVLNILFIVHGIMICGTHTHTHIYIYMCVCIERERERETDREVFVENVVTVL